VCSLVCKASLAQGGFFNHEGFYYCSADYQRQFGTKCVACGDYVEGEVVTALGNTYHQRCFTCSSCRLLLLFITSSTPTPSALSINTFHLDNCIIFFLCFNENSDLFYFFKEFHIAKYCYGLLK